MTDREYDPNDDGLKDGECSIVGCTRVGRLRRGWCAAHHSRFLRYGSPTRGGPSRGHVLEWVHAVAVPYDGEDCLTWPYSLKTNGYGQLTVGKKLHIASRFICELVHGKPPALRMDAAHSCGKGHLGCVNPRHLSWKTRAGNLADRLIHDTHARGERSVRAKLSERAVVEIRASKGRIKQTELAVRYGVARSTIAWVQQNRGWRWL